jgi:fructosamine-3-kinase
MPAAVHPLLTEPVRREIERAATRHTGRRWTPTGFTDLDDRASHPCGILHGTPLSVFAKLSTAAGGLSQFATELAGLQFLTDVAGIRTPPPIGTGAAALPGGGSLLLLQALPERPPADRTAQDWRAIGQTLATLHRARDDQFGLDRAAWFGPLPQDNRPVRNNRWADFYRDRRLLPMLAAAIGSGRLPAELIAGVERVAGRLPALIGPEPVPSLLHGDAQQHNFVSTDAGAAAVDPAPYFGHPEVDLALVDYFEPVPEEVFAGYREIARIDRGFTERRELWRMAAHLAVISVDGGSPFGRRHVDRLAAAVRRYR